MNKVGGKVGGCPGNAQPGSAFRGRRSAGASRLIGITGTLTATPAALGGYNVSFGSPALGVEETAISQGSGGCNWAWR